MEESIKKIVAGFLKLPVESVNHDTMIDRAALSNSIAVHRLFAKLAEAGVQVENYVEIRSVGELLQRTGGTVAIAPVPVPYKNGVEKKGSAAGIDIEEVSAMPRTNDFREEEFYKMNFAPSEIAYCILQPDPYASFAGLFAAKEAIVKAGTAYRNIPFNHIVIGREADGKPVYNGFSLSISHTGSLAVAVAVNIHAAAPEQRPLEATNNATPAARGANTWLWLLCMLTAIAALIIAITGK